FQLSAEVGAELFARKVVRTSNLTGCYAEYLFKEAYGWELQPNSKAGFDAQHKGIKYQIKSRRPTARNGSRQLGEFSKFEERRFDKLAVVIFHEDYQVHKAAIASYEAVARLSKVVQGRQRLNFEDKLWSEPEVEDVTEVLKAAQRDAPLLVEAGTVRRYR
ncbi:hypothetical protein, partial [Caulobacter segnis]|uniref:hypothetical protein n=1 Tax=Caulobacter segnis TaxID=88688 RepID=UPI0026EA2D46